MRESSNTRIDQQKRRRRGECGSTFVEFQLVLVPTMGLLFLAINVAWVLFGWACIQEAVREGVRYGVTGPVTSGLDNAIKTFVTNMAMGFANSQNSPTINVQYFSPTTFTEITGTSGATSSGNVLKVTANITMRTLVPVWMSTGSGLGKFNAWTPTLAAASADVLETKTPPPSE